MCSLSTEPATLANSQINFCLELLLCTKYATVASGFSNFFFFFGLS